MTTPEGEQNLSGSIKELVQQVSEQLEAKEQAYAEERKEHERRVTELEERIEELEEEKDQLEARFSRASGVNEQLTERLRRLQGSVQEELEKWNEQFDEVLALVDGEEADLPAPAAWRPHQAAAADPNEVERLRGTMKEVSEELKSAYLLLSQSELEGKKKGELLSILQYMDILLQDESPGAEEAPEEFDLGEMIPLPDPDTGDTFNMDGNG